MVFNADLVELFLVVVTIAEQIGKKYDSRGFQFNPREINPKQSSPNNGLEAITGIPIDSPWLHLALVNLGLSLVRRVSQPQATLIDCYTVRIA